MISTKKYLWLIVVILAWLIFQQLQYRDVDVVVTDFVNKLKPPDPEQPLPASSSVLHAYANAAICSDSNICSNIGRNTLQSGGSAVDAALASLFCNGLIAMQSMGLGGGFLMNIYIQSEQRSYSILARERAPKAVNEDILKAENMTSAHFIAVPAEVMGYAEAYKRFGKLSWAELIKPTIQLCHKGFQLSKHQRDALLTNQAMILQDKHLRQTFLNSSTRQFYPVGTHIKPVKNLCQSYEQLARNGPEDFYYGQLSRHLVADLHELGSNISIADLEAVTVDVKPSVELPLGHFKLHLTPPPGSGHIIGYVMNILKIFRKDFEHKINMELGATALHRIVEALKFGFAKRWDLDMSVDEQLLQQLTSASYAAHKANLINDTNCSDDPRDYGANINLSPQNEYGTAHISVLASNGDAVSATSSINYYFGCGRSGSRTGIIFNNAMADFSIESFPNYFGLPELSKRNRISSGNSPMSSMSPIIVTDLNGRVRLVVGAAGGTKIISALVHLLVRVLWLDQNIKVSIDAARFHHQLLPNILEYEYGLVGHLIDDLSGRGHKMQRYRERGSAICGIERRNSTIYANADFRKDGGVDGF